MQYRPLLHNCTEKELKNSLCRNYFARGWRVPMLQIGPRCDFRAWFDLRSCQSIIFDYCFYQIIPTIWVFWLSSFLFLKFIWLQTLWQAVYYGVPYQDGIFALKRDVNSISQPALSLSSTMLIVFLNPHSRFKARTLALKHDFKARWCLAARTLALKRSLLLSAYSRALTHAWFLSALSL